MSATQLIAKGSTDLSQVIQRYGCGPVRLAGSEHALYRRSLFSDNVINLAAATPRDKFDAMARSVRDILSQRWVLTGGYV